MTCTFARTVRTVRTYFLKAMSMKVVGAISDKKK